MTDGEGAPMRTVIGGRHGSPTINVVWPFSKVVNVDAELRESVAQLASLVGTLAESPGAEELETVRTRAAELAERLRSA